MLGAAPASPPRSSSPTVPPRRAHPSLPPRPTATASSPRKRSRATYEAGSPDASPARPAVKPRVSVSQVKAHLFPAKSPSKRPANSTANSTFTAHTPAPAKRTPLKALTLNGAGAGYAVDGMGSGLSGVALAPRKLGVSHLGLLYETVGARMRCRMCLPGTQGVLLSATAPWGARGPRDERARGRLCGAA
ncbi:hypothetical protein B0H17DRAFT_1062445 [Mycena rosella]|uniref:Uncharacterized protein n=1 Tax=Mycena rosella TaxID=1033263 RepID=A0AAD7GF80_MYCRO|nr:hypothetical protein B0H17DRAFT_1062445 [Mycena rosella]